MDLFDSRMNLIRFNQEPWKMNAEPARVSDVLARMNDVPEKAHRWSSEDEHSTYQI